ncbi:MAG: SDR family NAD(P)-dependent oxidoreductase [Gemmatimonadales bacterium]|nr:SDR family NAD(P)-dependent oxidoreductase [Gemmatimonadales bacterium]
MRAAGVTDAALADPAYVRRGAPLEHMSAFDAGFFGLSPREAAIMDPQHRHFLEVSWEALEHAGHPPGSLRGPVGVFAGSGHNAYFSANVLTHPELLASDGFFLLRHTGNDKDFLTTRVSYLLDLQGPSVAVQTACSTSLVAVHLGVQSLLAGECDLALAGGVTIELPHGQGYHFAEGEILAPDGRCRAFDAASAGTVFGSGAGVVVLRRLADALADGDTVYAVVKGTAVNNDGSGKVSYLAPSVEGQASAVAEALAVAGVDADTVGYVAAHGTGTPVGDPIEVAALSDAFRRQTQRRGYCTMHSVKGNIGHLDTAAGVASLIAAVQALRHREFPPQLHFNAPNPACELERSPFRVTGSLERWESTTPRRAGVSSLGVGGTNAHVVLEERADEAAGAARADGEQLLIVSAKTPEALERNVARLAAHLRTHPDTPLADAAWTLQVGRQPMKHRRAVVAAGAVAAAEALEVDDARSRIRDEARAGRSVAFMFAGGGAQFPGMGAALYRTEPVYRDAIDEGLALLARHTDTDLRGALFPASGHEAAAARELERPSRTLPALFLTQVAQARLWASWGIVPTAMIGHSMGEYTAAHLAGVFSLDDALRLVLLRGQLFERVPGGAMLSVALPARELAALLAPELSVAAENGPALSVASGPVASIERLQRELESREVDCVRVRIDVAAHSAMLEPIIADFRAFLAQVRFGTPGIPFVSNRTGTWIADAEATSPDYWVRHLRETVRFGAGVAVLAADPDRALLEVGPGRTLATLARQLPERPAGQPVITYGGAPRRRIGLPTYAFERTRHWIAPLGAPASGGTAPRADDARRPLGEWTWQPSWRRRLPPPAGSGLPGTTLIVPDRGGVAAALADALRGRGIEVEVASPASLDDWRALLDRLAAAGRLPRSIVHARAVDPMGDPFAAASATDAQEVGFHDVLALLQTVGALDLAEPLAITVLSSGMQQVAGEPRLEPAKATLLGPVRVAPRELPGVQVRSVDVVPPTSDWEAGRLTGQLLDELAAADAATSVAWRGDDRWELEYEPLALDRLPLAPRLARHGVYLVTGGYGGIGEELAEHLARAWQARLVLVGRTLPPDRADLVRRLEALGGDVLCLQADVTDLAAMRSAVAQARARFGPLDGVFHAAGVLDDHVLQLKDPASAARVLAPKVQGTLVLDAATRDESLPLLVLFSSVSAVAGFAGQVDYAAANAFLDAYAAARRARDGTLALAINWAAWRGVGMTAELGRALGVDDGALRHPLLQRELPAARGTRRFAAPLDVARHWLVADHRLADGTPLVPGTGHLELARAAYAAHAHPDAVVLRDVAFRAPLMVPASEARDVCVQLVPDGDGMRFSVLARSAPGTDAWTEHATGTVGAAAAAAVPPLDLAGIAQRCRRAAERFDVARTSPHLAFGPRWDVIRDIAYGDGEALLTLELDQALAADLASYPLHPALLDMATGTSQRLLDGFEPTRDFHVPLSYGEVRALAPLTRALRSHVRLRREAEGGPDFATFDVTVTDPDGRVLVEVRDYVMMRLGAGQLLAAAPAGRTVSLGADAARPVALANQLFERVLREGIAPDEGMQLLEALLTRRVPAQVVVTPHDLRWVRETAARTDGRKGGGAEGRNAPEGTSPSSEPPTFRALPAVAAVITAHPAVSAAAAMEVHDQAGERRVVAFVVYRAGEQATHSELRRACRAGLDAELVPQAFVDLDALPRDERGEVRHDALPNPYAPATEASEPATAMERLIASLWHDLLGTARVGRHDNFFDLGGHSLLSMRFLARLDKRAGVRLLHEHVVVSTLQQLAARAEQLGGAAA